MTKNRVTKNPPVRSGLTAAPPEPEHGDKRQNLCKKPPHRSAEFPCKLGTFFTMSKMNQSVAQLRAALARSEESAAKDRQLREEAEASVTKFAQMADAALAENKKLREILEPQSASLSLCLCSVSLFLSLSLCLSLSIYICIYLSHFFSATHSLHSRAMFSFSPVSQSFLACIQISNTL